MSHANVEVNATNAAAVTANDEPEDIDTEQESDEDNSEDEWASDTEDDGASVFLLCETLVDVLMSRYNPAATGSFTPIPATSSFGAEYEMVVAALDSCDLPPPSYPAYGQNNAGNRYIVAGRLDYSGGGVWSEFVEKRVYDSTSIGVEYVIRLEGGTFAYINPNHRIGAYVRARGRRGVKVVKHQSYWEKSYNYDYAVDEETRAWEMVQSLWHFL